MVTFNLLRYRIARAVDALLGRELAPPNVEKPTDAEPKGLTHANYISQLIASWDETFRLGYNRRRRYQEYDLMDDAEIAAQLDHICNACLISDDGRTRSFQVRAGAKYQNIIEGVIEATDLHNKIRRILRDTLKFGDEFDEIILDSEYNIAGLQSIPCEEIFVNVDEHNQLRRGTVQVPTPEGMQELPAAYHQRDSSDRVVAAWYPWEMLHLKWNPSDKHIYSAGSYLEPLRRTWHRLRLMEDGLTVARLVRAYLRQIHYLDVTGKSDEDAQAELETYRRALAQKKLSGGSVVDRPLAVDEDLFVTTGYLEKPDGSLEPKLTKIDVVDPANRGLSDIDDLRYHRQKLFVYLPAEIVGFETDRRDLSQQDVAASRLYQYCQRLLEDQLLWPLFRLALLLKGYQPRREDIEIIWPQVIVRSSWRFSDAFFRRMMGWRNAVEMGVVSRGYVARDELSMSPEQWDEVRSEIEGEAEVMPPIPQASQAAQTTQGNRSA